MGQVFSQGMTNPATNQPVQAAGQLSPGVNPPTMLGQNDQTSGGPTKANKLLQVLRYGISGAEGALAGRAAQEQMIAQTGGRRAGGIGTGFEAGFQSPFQRAMMPLQLQQQQAETQLAQAGAQPIQTPYGQVPTSYLPKFLSPMLKLQGTEETNATHQNIAQQGNQTKRDIAQQANQNKLDVVGLQTAISAQKGAKFLPDVDPNTGQNFYHVVNPFGQEIGRSDVNVIPSLMTRSSSTTDFKEDENGNIIALPKTTVSGPQIPRGSGPASRPAVAPVANNGPAVGGAAQTPTNTGNRPNAGSVTPSGPRVVMQGKTAADVGLAFDPNSNEYVQTTRTDAATQGYQQFNKITSKEQEENRQLNNRLYDVATKITRYEDALKTFGGGGTMDKTMDRTFMASLLQSDKFKAGAFGMELPVDKFNQLVDAQHANVLSPEARNVLLAYYNARESMLGYQRVLTGGSKSNEKGLELNLQALPSPVMPTDFGLEGIRQFKENIRVAGQGLPRMLGIKRAQDVLGNQSVGNTPAQPGASQPMTNIPAFLSRLGVR